MQQKPRKVLLITLGIICLTISLISCLNIITSDTISSNYGDPPLASMASTNSSSPQWMSDDSTCFEYTYSSLTTYYYYNYGIATNYTLVWLYTVSSSNNFDLELYSDSSYSNLLDGSSSTGQLDWIVYRPLSTGEMYPKSYTTTGSGEALIESELGHHIEVNSPYSVEQLYTTDYVEIYQISLSSSINYTVFLDVSSGSDYDLHVFRMLTGSSIKSDFHNSTSTTTGQYERIVFSPLYNDTYAIVVTQASGEGAASLIVYDYIYVPTPDEIPIFELFPVLLALAAIVFLYLTTLKRNNLLF